MLIHVLILKKRDVTSPTKVKPEETEEPGHPRVENICPFRSNLIVFPFQALDVHKFHGPIPEGREGKTDQRL